MLGFQFKLARHKEGDSEEYLGSDGLDIYFTYDSPEKSTLKNVVIREYSNGPTPWEIRYKTISYDFEKQLATGPENEERMRFYERFVQISENVPPKKVEILKKVILNKF